MPDDMLPGALSRAMEMTCYTGVPSDIVEMCEQAHLVSKVVRLQALCSVRDWLAPYGQFRQWCLDHGENYHNVQSQLSQAFGNVTKRAIKNTESAAWLEAPEAATIEAQAEHIRALEAELAQYRAQQRDELDAMERSRVEVLAAKHGAVLQIDLRLLRTADPENTHWNQPRVRLDPPDEPLVAAIQASDAGGYSLDSIRVWVLPDDSIALSNGRARCEARWRNGKVTIWAEVFRGDHSDVLRDAVVSNRPNPLTAKDIQRAEQWLAEAVALEQGATE